MPSTGSPTGWKKVESGTPSRTRSTTAHGEVSVRPTWIASIVRIPENGSHRSAGQSNVISASSATSRRTADVPGDRGDRCGDRRGPQVDRTGDGARELRVLHPLPVHPVTDQGGAGEGGHHGEARRIRGAVRPDERDRRRPRPGGVRGLVPRQLPLPNRIAGARWRGSACPGQQGTTGEADDRPAHRLSLRPWRNGSARRVCSPWRSRPGGRGPFGSRKVRTPQGRVLARARRG